MKPIRGYFEKKTPSPFPSINIGSQIDNGESVKKVKQEILDTVDEKLGEVEQIISQAISQINKKQEEIISMVSSRSGLNGRNGRDANEEKVIEAVVERLNRQDMNVVVDKVLNRLPSKDEIADQVLERVKIPTPKSNLKVIQQKVEVDPLSVIDKILALPPEKLSKLKLKSSNIDGLDQTISSFRNQISTRGYLHGGGDTVAAGTNITITTVNGTKVISSTGGGGLSLLTATGAVDGSNRTFIFTTAPSIIVVNQNRMMQKVSSNGNVNWTGTTTVVLQVAPTTDIYGL